MANTKIINNKNIIFWDFDGVIMDSMAVRNEGFELVLSDYPEDQVKKLMDFHLKNGGLSRYVKFRYFFEEIRNENITDDEISVWASRFSDIMRRELLNSQLLIKTSIDFIKENNGRFEMHIVSGSDQNELRYLCKGLGLASYFKSINGSPTPKNKLVKDLLSEYNYPKEECVLVGDSINDYDAAQNNGIDFLGFNNSELLNLGSGYINNFEHE